MRVGLEGLLNHPHHHGLCVESEGYDPGDDELPHVDIYILQVIQSEVRYDELDERFQRIQSHKSDKNIANSLSDCVNLLSFAFEEGDAADDPHDDEDGQDD